jgi:hypothetical protein
LGRDQASKQAEEEEMLIADTDADVEQNDDDDGAVHGSPTYNISCWRQAGRRKLSLQQSRRWE